MTSERVPVRLNTLRRKVTTFLLGALVVPIFAAGCGSREVVIKDENENTSSEAQEMLDFQKQMFNEQVQQTNEQNREQQ